MLFLTSGSISNTQWLPPPLLCPPINISFWVWETQVSLLLTWDLHRIFDIVFLTFVSSLLDFPKWTLMGILSVLQVFRHLLPRSQKRRRLQLPRRRLRCRARACWTSALLVQPPPAPSSPPAVSLATALLSATQPAQAVQGAHTPPQCPLERSVCLNT